MEPLPAAALKVVDGHAHREEAEREDASAAVWYGHTAIDEEEAAQPKEERILGEWRHEEHEREHQAHDRQANRTEHPVQDPLTQLRGAGAALRRVDGDEGGEAGIEHQCDAQQRQEHPAEQPRRARPRHSHRERHRDGQRCAALCAPWQGQEAGRQACDVKPLLLDEAVQGAARVVDPLLAGPDQADGADADRDRGNRRQPADDRQVVQDILLEKKISPASDEGEDADLETSHVWA